VFVDPVLLTELHRSLESLLLIIPQVADSRKTIAGKMSAARGGEAKVTSHKGSGVPKLGHQHFLSVPRGNTVDVVDQFPPCLYDPIPTPRGHRGSELMRKNPVCRRVPGAGVSWSDSLNAVTQQNLNRRGARSKHRDNSLCHEGIQGIFRVYYIQTPDFLVGTAVCPSDSNPTLFVQSSP
jgi:hypothetical protein